MTKNMNECTWRFCINFHSQAVDYCLHYIFKYCHVRPLFMNSKQGSNFSGIQWKTLVHKSCFFQGDVQLKSKWGKRLRCELKKFNWVENASNSVWPYGLTKTDTHKKYSNARNLEFWWTVVLNRCLNINCGYVHLNWVWFMKVEYFESLKVYIFEYFVFVLNSAWDIFILQNVLLKIIRWFHSFDYYSTALV